MKLISKCFFINIYSLKFNISSKDLFFFRDCKNFDRDFISFAAKGFITSSDLLVGKRPVLLE
jgi:hypothetical protein